MGLQQEVAEFVATNRLQATPQIHLLDAVSELGEVAKSLLKTTSYGQQDFAPESDWQNELGDVGYSLYCLAEASGVDLETAIREALDRYRKRIEQTGSPGSGQ